MITYAIMSIRVVVNGYSLLLTQSALKNATQGHPARKPHVKGMEFTCVSTKGIHLPPTPPKPPLSTQGVVYNTLRCTRHSWNDLSRMFNEYRYRYIYITSYNIYWTRANIRKYLCTYVCMYVGSSDRSLFRPNVSEIANITSVNRSPGRFHANDCRKLPNV